jgi:transposase
MKPTYEQLENRVIELESIILKMQQTIDQLESRLGKNSRNSSNPPSSDQKPNNPPSDDSPKQRPYHLGMKRQLLPEEMITSRETRRTEICPRCRSAMEFTGEVTSWQQVELPSIKPLVHQIDLQTCRCPNCRLIDIPELSQSEIFLLGPRLEGLANLLMTQFRQGHQPVRQFFSLLIPGLFLSQGLISKIKKRAANAFDHVNGLLREAILQGEEPVHGDATGWRHQGKNHHALILRSGSLIQYSIVSHQNATTIGQLFYSSKPIHLVCDRGLAIKKVALRALQYCLAHLLRNLEGAAEHSSTTAEEAQLLGEVHEMLQGLFHDKHRHETGELGRSTWLRYSYSQWQVMREIIDTLLERGSHKALRRFCKKLLRDWKHFMVYLSTGGPMTNNPAEEALRNLVIVRKLCFGSRSEYGRRWRETVQSCVETLRRQKQSVLDFLTETIRASREGTPYPSFV